MVGSAPIGNDDRLYGIVGMGRLKNEAERAGSQEGSQFRHRGKAGTILPL